MKLCSGRGETYPLIVSLIRAERTPDRQPPLTHRWGKGTVEDLDTFVFGDTPLDEGEVRELATAAFPDATRNTIFIGAGTGKSHLSRRMVNDGVTSSRRGLS